MIQLQLQPELEAQLAAEARARGLSIALYVEQIVRTRPLEHAETSVAGLDLKARAAKLERFLERMASHTEQISLPPGEAFTREGIYQDHD